MSGDLSFFGNPDGHITHTGMILENSQIIHSSGKVRIDKIDNRGIFNANDKIYSHELLMIKRIIDLNHL
jgi:cell wall-associated NlpC family hydrolase